MYKPTLQQNLEMLAAHLTPPGQVGAQVHEAIGRRVVVESVSPAEVFLGANTVQPRSGWASGDPLVTAGSRLEPLAAFHLRAAGIQRVAIFGPPQGHVLVVGRTDLAYATAGMVFWKVGLPGGKHFGLCYAGETPVVIMPDVFYKTALQVHAYLLRFPIQWGHPPSRSEHAARWNGEAGLYPVVVGKDGAYPLAVHDPFVGRELADASGWVAAENARQTTVTVTSFA